MIRPGALSPSSARIPILAGKMNHTGGKNEHALPEFPAGIRMMKPDSLPA